MDRIERTSWADADTISRSTVQCLAGAANGDYQEEKGTPLQESSRQSASNDFSLSFFFFFFLACGVYEISALSCFAVRNASERLQSALKSARELRENELQQKEEQKGRELEEREKQLWRDLWNIEKKKQEAREENEEVSEL